MANQKLSAEQLKKDTPLTQVLEHYHLLESLNKDKKGLRGTCPFCASKRGFYAYTDNNYYCHSCKAKGSIIDFIMNQENLSFKEACKYLKQTFTHQRGPKPPQALEEAAPWKGEVSLETPLKPQFEKLWELLESIDAEGKYYDALGVIEDIQSTYVDIYFI